MEMLLHVGGLGFGIGGTKIGFSAAKAAHIHLRNGAGEGHKSIHIYNHFDVGSSGPNAGISALMTKWFPVNASQHPWLRK